jgi:hypothetical protein
VHRPVAAPSRSLQCDCHWLSEPAVRENLIIYWLHAHRQEFPCYRIAGHLRAHPKVALTMTIAVRHGVQKFCVGICFFDMWCSNVWCGDMWCCVTWSELFLSPSAFIPDPGTTVMGKWALFSAGYGLSCPNQAPFCHHISAWIIENAFCALGASAN